MPRASSKATRACPLSAAATKLAPRGRRSGPHACSSASAADLTHQEGAALIGGAIDRRTMRSSGVSNWNAWSGGAARCPRSRALLALAFLGSVFHLGSSNSDRRAMNALAETMRVSS
jgi:hypothetical protein